MARRNLPAVTVAVIAAMLGLAAPPARAADTVILGSVGSASANQWPVYIGINKGFFAAEGIKVDLVFAQSNAAVHQQLAAGSLHFAINTGLVDPIRAIEKGAAAAIVRIEVQGPPYILMGRAAIKSMRELKGKVISLGGAKDITRIFVERMLAAYVHGDLQALGDLVTASFDGVPELRRRFLTDRNATWMTALDALARRQGSQLVVVGTGHLLGEDGVIARLRQSGHRITRL